MRVQISRSAARTEGDEARARCDGAAPRRAARHSSGIERIMDEVPPKGGPQWVPDSPERVARPVGAVRSERRRSKSAHREVLSGTLEESQIECAEYQNDARIRHQPGPEPVLEEQDVHGDNDGCHQHDIECESSLSSHLVPPAGTGPRNGTVMPRNIGTRCAVVMDGPARSESIIRSVRRSAV